MLQTVAWTGSAARLIDQTRLPAETVYVDIKTPEQMWDAIRRLVVRGAPAIGVAAAFGAYLGIANCEDDAAAARLKETCAYLATSRPTAVNLFWALQRVQQVAEGRTDIRRVVLDECIAMLEEDNRVCRAIGEHGLRLLRALPTDSEGRIPLLTHCNAGGLATVQYGTALAPIYVGAEQQLKFHVYSDETRPLLQGSRITAFELQANGIPVTVICDSMAAAVMQEGKIGAVIVGTDRVAANGDVANKVGTLGVAIAAKHFGISFYVAAPTSSIDLSLACGALIPIEQRDPTEITAGLGRVTAPADVGVFNPAFDVTPADLVTAIITEHGVARAPYGASLRDLVEQSPRRAS